MAGAEADRLHHPGRVDQPGLRRAAGPLEQAGPRIGGRGDPVGAQAQLGRQRGALPADLIGLDSDLLGDCAVFLAPVALSRAVVAASRCWKA